MSFVVSQTRVETYSGMLRGRPTILLEIASLLQVFRLRSDLQTEQSINMVYKGERASRELCTGIEERELSIVGIPECLASIQ